ncbi:MAG: outer membrane lipoprotein carrier protein LolA [Phycisphaerae bacterium]
MKPFTYQWAIWAGLVAVCGAPEGAFCGQPGAVPPPPSNAPNDDAASAEGTQPAGDRVRYESAKKELLGSWAKVHAITLHIATEGEFERADVLERTEGGGTYDYLKKDGVAYVRAERRTQSVPIPGQTHVSGPSDWALMISDGSSVYTHQKRGSKEHVYKDAVEFNRLPHMGAEQFFTELENFDIYQLMPDEKLGTHDCYVFEARPQSGNPVVTYHVDKAVGVVLRFHIDDRLNHRFNTLAVEEMGINPTFRPNHFQFKVPKGVAFTDRTPKSKESKTKKANDAPASENKPD